MFLRSLSVERHPLSLIPRDVGAGANTIDNSDTMADLGLTDSLTSSTSSSTRVATSSLSSSARTTSTTSSAARDLATSITSSRTSSSSSSSSSSARTSSHTTTSTRISTSSSSSATSTSTAPSRLTRTSRTSTHSSTSSSTHTSSSATSSIVTSTTASSTSSSATATSTVAAANVNGSGSSSSLSGGAIAGIVIGSIAGIVLIALLITAGIRKKSRAERAKRRSSVFDWGTTADMDNMETYEKPRYDPPSESFAMAEANNNPQHVSYATNDFAVAPPAAERTEPLSYAERHNPQYSYRNSFQPVSLVPDLPPAQPPAQASAQAQGSFAAQPQQQNMVGAGGAPGTAGVGAAAGAVPGSGAAAAAAGPRGVTAGTWVSVKVGFVRSLEDELPINPGQKLYLHEVYDDGWSLCEDEEHKKGVVPVNCLQSLQ
ncbi:hypothetical protein IAS59_003616 [Cryptococcus gattii]